jgi:uncharacterized protein
VEAKAALRTADLPAALSNQLLHLILMPTEACNFRCVYCYEDFRYKRMEPWVVSGVKRLLTRRAPRLRSLLFSWFGGEPLLASDVIEEVMVHARGLRSTRPELGISADMTTNGYLLAPALFERMVGLGVNQFQISFDGPREWHDRKRILAGGKGTFERIWSNLLAARESGREFAITVRVHADRLNAGVLPGFLQQYKRAFGSDPRFKLFIRSLSRLGGPHDASLEIFDREEGDRVIGALRDLARSEGLALADITGRESVCYASRPNSFLVRANGRLNKCTVALEHPNNQVGRIHEDGTVEVRSPRVAGWMRGFVSGDAQELKCPMIGYASKGEGSHGTRAIPLEPLPLPSGAGESSAAGATGAIPGRERVRSQSSGAFDV